ncbi:dipeptidase [Sphingosinicella microcystinivorans]|uniref:Membrane dipeptidase n=1 Tax=Sphingosinicella microcystinivorans TaxID=335406 RepID=A0AAD1D313_SPHMI|nr:membrane dipeptidase [Sphingosinicella microcystinivorans]RKS88657.1 membrane dipeptidase [Sphingosinicella microcystinivorans]BBE32404.1 membrane dipeptidase [Sphingosinicella microcystinivorans]
MARMTDAENLVRDALVWDNHTCLPLRPDDHDFFARLRAIAAAGVDVISVNIGFGPVSLAQHEAMIAGLTRWLAREGDWCRLVRSVADIEAARGAGKLAVFFDAEGMAPLDAGGEALVEPWRKAGVGWMLVAYNAANCAGSGCTDEVDGGLTDHGKRILAEMRRVGMIACCSHTGHRTAMAVMEHAGAPVIFSHSNAAGVFAHCRNIPDDLIRACAETGGVVGINGLAGFLGEGPASVSRLVDHIEHVAGLVGTDHVGLGLDYVFDKQELVDYLASKPELFPDAASMTHATSMIGPGQVGAIATELLARGADVPSVRKILGENWMRVARAVWR